MDVPVMVCECGMQVKVPGARPGRVGRCPRCGGRLQVPEIPPAEALPSRSPADDEPMAGGYGLAMQKPAPASQPTSQGKKTRRPGEDPAPLRNRRPMADGPLPPLQRPERGWFASFLYPLRGAECLGVIAVLALISWVFYVLVPEYGLTVMRDASSMGAGLMGVLFVLIAAVPVVLLSPFLISYGLQYLGRILVSSAMGETIPPRTPDRNFDGFFNGLSPWCIWLVLGLGVGLLPASWYVSSRGLMAGFNGIEVILVLAAMPYILAALMMSFLHDDPIAPKPWSVIHGIFALGAPFLALSAFIAASLGLALATFGVALLIRSHVYILFLLLCLGCWAILYWTIIVVMRLLGTYYYHHKDGLRWHYHHPRWGVAWRL